MGAVVWCLVSLILLVVMAFGGVYCLVRFSRGGRHKTATESTKPRSEEQNFKVYPVPIAPEPTEKEPPQITENPEPIAPRLRAPKCRHSLPKTQRPVPVRL